MPILSSFRSLSGIVLVACAFYTIISLLDISLDSNLLKYSYKQHSPGQGKLSESSYLVDTPGCKIPKTKILPDNFTLLKMKKPFNCKPQPFTSRLDESEQIIQLAKDYVGKNCTLTEIQSDEKEAGLFRLLQPVAINSSLPLNSREMMLTSCDRLTTFHYNYPITPEIQAKIQHWKDKENVPVSVLLFGIDTTSRSHFHRSMPQTSKLLRDLNFVDFNGYHTHYVKTLDVMLAVHLGMSYKQVKKQNGRKPLDDLGLLWTHFSARNYVTMYIEDESSSLGSWKYVTFPFKNRPTDYFPQPMFNYMHKLVREKGIRQSSNCVAWEPKPPVVLNYTRRFVEKFQQTPFFAFTWFCWPFHDNPEYLHEFDHQLASFFQWLKSSPDFLRRTFIVFFADHGVRWNTFAQYTYEGFLERSLPFLFMRIPELLTEKHENIIQNVNINSKRLSTPYDIHHTFLHLLNLNNSEFTPVLENRSSLFLPLPLNRTCKSAGISEQYCVCNAVKNATQLTNPYFLQQLYTFGVEELNNYIDNSPYKGLCRRFEKLADFDARLMARVVRSTTHFDLILFRFEVDAGGAEFEITVKVNKRTKGTMERIGIFNRVNRYGDQSWCVNADSGKDVDGIMNYICVCKKKRPSKSQSVSSNKFFPLWLTRTFQFLPYSITRFF